MRHQPFFLFFFLPLLWPLQTHEQHGAMSFRVCALRAEPLLLWCQPERSLFFGWSARCTSGASLVAPQFFKNFIPRKNLYSFRIFCAFLPRLGAANGHAQGHNGRLSGPRHCCGDRPQANKGQWSGESSPLFSFRFF
nr:hypothetical protein [Pandoravirus aubagnensis]